VSAPRNLSRKRMQALIDMADYGLDEAAYNLREEAGIQPLASNAEIRKSIEVDDYGYVNGSFYTKAEIWEIVEKHRAAVAAIQIISRRLTSTTSRLGTEQEQGS